ncbi:MAG: hypothetical protein JO142_03790 [Burkholderiales bacterium]|nr:hypothetical protein [Burkholderiales bacterium]
MLSPMLFSRQSGPQGKVATPVAVPKESSRNGNGAAPITARSRPAQLAGVMQA